MTLRKTCADKLAKVLPGRKVVRDRQIEGNIRAAVRHEYAGGIPLVN